MKILLTFLLAVFLASCNVTQQTAATDGIYGQHQPRPKKVKPAEESSDMAASSEADYYGNYDDYPYASRIRRFHRPYSPLSYYGGLFYDPFYYNYPYSPGWSVSVGWGWGSPYYGFGYYDPWFNPFGYPYYGYPYGWGGIGYGSGYYRGFYDGYYSAPGNREYASRGYYYGQRGSISRGYSSGSRQPGEGRPRGGIRTEPGQGREDVNPGTLPDRNPSGVQTPRPPRQPQPRTEPQRPADNPDPGNMPQPPREAPAPPRPPRDARPRYQEPAGEPQQTRPSAPPVFRESRPSGGNSGGGVNHGGRRPR